MLQCPTHTHTPQTFSPSAFRKVVKKNACVLRKQAKKKQKKFLYTLSSPTINYNAMTPGKEKGYNIRKSIERKQGNYFVIKGDKEFFIYFAVMVG